MSAVRFPELRGSEKQTKWAVGIRQRAYERFGDAIQGVIETVNTSAWWIAYRYEFSKPNPDLHKINEHMEVQKTKGEFDELD